MFYIHRSVHTVTYVSATHDAGFLEYEKKIMLKTIAAAHPIHGASHIAPSTSKGSSTPHLDPIIVQSLQQITTSLYKLGATVENIRMYTTKESEAKKPGRGKLDNQTQ